MFSESSGKIINIASVLSFQGGINVIAYAASKHGLAGLTRAPCNDWAGKGINVNAIAPGFFETGFSQALKKDDKRSRAIIGRTPAGRSGNPEDIAGAALFLASLPSDFVNGIILPAGGGSMSW
jgi:2-deoxy-D-gluconate 3-dehydrogenase